MSPGDDPSLPEFHGIESADMIRRRVCPQSEHLIEIAVIEIPLPVHRYRVTAHESGQRRRIECGDQFLHVGFKISRVDQEFQKTADRNIGDGEQVIEGDPVVCR